MAALLVASLAGAQEAPANEVLVTAAATSRLLVNDSFEQWEGDTPTGWEVSIPKAVAKAAEGEKGKVVASVTPQEKDPVDIRQLLKPDLFLPGDTLLLIVECYADNAGAAEAVIRQNAGEGGKRVVNTESHPGGGWAMLPVMVALQDPLPASIEFRLRVAPGNDAPVRVRSIRAEVVPAIP